MSQQAARESAVLHFQSFRRQRANATILDYWINGEQRQAEEHKISELTGEIYAPRDVTDEYRDIAKRSPTPVASLLVRTMTQTSYVDGIRRADSEDNMEVYSTWQANNWDLKQIALHAGAAGHGQAFGTVSRGFDPLTGEKMARMSAFSAKRMAAFYDRDDLEWPYLAMLADPVLGKPGEWTVRLWDEVGIYYLSTKNDGVELKDWEFISSEEHGFRVAPIVQYANQMDLDGRATGEIEPVLPMLARIDQDTFDRLIVQRYGAWKIRYIAGMAKPDNLTDARAQALRMKIEDLLIAPNPETKFGTLDATSTDDFIKASDHDLRLLAAVTQRAPHHLLGLSSNLQAEALAATEAGLQRRSADFKTSMGESHERMARLVAIANDNPDEARATNVQVRWRDTESRSLVQAANSLGLLATALGVPVEMLWERIPGWTDLDTARAKTLVETGRFEQLLRSLEAEAEAQKNVQQPASTGGSDNESTSGSNG